MNLIGKKILGLSLLTAKRQFILVKKRLDFHKKYNDFSGLTDFYQRVKVWSK